MKCFDKIHARIKDEAIKDIIIPKESETKCLMNNIACSKFRNYELDKNPESVNSPHEREMSVNFKNSN